MAKHEIANSIYYIGVNDKDIDLFEGQYVVPNGVSYNSYLLKDDMNVVLDTVDKRGTEQWVKNLEEALDGEKVDYLIITHLEPDHGYNIELLCKKFPKMRIIATQKAFDIIPQFFDIPNFEKRKIVIGDGGYIDMGKHTFRFISAPMVHWPEVIFAYENTEGILFSADAFGRFGLPETKENWIDEARRYYFNIVGKYGLQVQNVLKKASHLKINKICPLHGPILDKDIEYYIEKYSTWCSYKPEDEGVFIAYASIHGNTADSAKKLGEILKENGEENVVLMDLARSDISIAIENAFRYSKLVLAASSYNAGVFPPMEHFLNELKGKNYQHRKVGIIENGTWAPSAGNSMLKIVEEMKNMKVCTNKITIKSKMNEENVKQLGKLAKELMKA